MPILEQYQPLLETPSCCILHIQYKNCTYELYKWTFLLYIGYDDTSASQHSSWSTHFLYEQNKNNSTCTLALFLLLYNLCTFCLMHIVYKHRRKKWSNERWTRPDADRTRNSIQLLVVSPQATTLHYVATVTIALISERVNISSAGLVPKPKRDKFAFC